MDTQKQKNQKIKQFLGGILILAIVFAVTMYAIKKYKRPGQASLLESQAMDMGAMVAPKGSVPVAVEKGKREKFSSKVTYTGTVVPYNEVDVFPRVTGWLIELKVYPGDEVKRGEVIARLDSSELSSRTNEAVYNYDVSEHDTLNMLYELKMAKQRVETRKAELEKVQAEVDYWTAEIKRQEKLYQEGAVSKEELDMETAQYKTSLAMLKQAKAELEEALQEVEAVSHKKEFADAMKKRSKASAATANIIKGYTEIKSLVDGVVTQRLISPGVLISPGMLILKIAQIDKVRLQANVAEKDLSDIKVGNTVSAYTIKNPEKKIEAEITSVFPASDPSSRTAIVEAIVENTENYFLPGEYVVMEISGKSENKVLTVPAKAVLKNAEGREFVWTVGKGTTKGSKTIYYCVMHPEVTSDKPGECPKCGMKLQPKESGGKGKAHLVFVKTGITDGQKTEIVIGLSKNDEVIYAGHEYLKESDTVFKTEWGITGAKQLPPPPGMEGMSGHTGKEGRTDHSGMKGMNDMKGMKH